MLHLIYLILLLSILVIVIVILKKQSKQNAKESFANCFGAQYNGLPFLENPKKAICPKQYTPNDRTGGCVEYDPQKISVEYAMGNKTFIPFV